MTYTALQRLQGERAKLLAQLKKIQASPQLDLEEEANLFELLEANTAAIYKARPPEPDLQKVVCIDETYHRSEDWLSIN